MFNFSINFDNPALLVMVFPVIGVVLWRLHRKKADAIRFGGVEYLVDGGLNLAVDKSRNRMLLILIMIGLIGLAWSAPKLRTSQPLPFGPAHELTPVYLLALDVSGSMTEPLGGWVVDGNLNLDGPTRFAASQAELYAFMAKNPAANFGLILFSVQPMLVRWPTTQNEYSLRDVLDQGMKYTNANRSQVSQLARFAGGTATRAGLVMAKDVLLRQNAPTRSLVLIGDLIDDIDEVIDGITDIYQEKDVYVYVLALDTLPESLELFTGTFDDKSNVKFFSINSTAQMSKAFSDIENIEKNRQIRTGSQNFIQDIKWLISLMAFLLAISIFILFETKLHKTHN